MKIKIKEDIDKNYEEFVNVTEYNFEHDWIIIRFTDSVSNSLTHIEFRNITRDTKMIIDDDVEV
jgi:hypothetical protein